MGIKGRLWSVFVELDWSQLDETSQGEELLTYLNNKDTLDDQHEQRGLRSILLTYNLIVETRDQTIFVVSEMI